ncbi:MAG: LPS export ABC transporter permease LptG [Alphaproteobacteria bacterium]|nr:LPS export ABC transporter permease LptG [Alphaproteobacteria bacterium]
MNQRLLSRYISRRFLFAVTSSFMLCAGLIYMIDFVEMLRQAGKYGGGSLAMTAWITLLRLPAYSEVLLTFAVLVGGIATFLNLSRSSELAVMRAGGMSAWQFLRPSFMMAFLIGLIAITIYNPLSALARAESERLHAEVFGKSSDFLSQQSGLPWMRQDGNDGPSVIWAASTSDNGLKLTRPNILQYNRDQKFVERVKGKQATLQDGHWIVEDGWVVRPGEPPQYFETYAVPTYLSPDRVRDAMGSVRSLSFWELPTIIDLAERAGLTSAPYHVQYQTLLSRPFLLALMVLLAGTVSLKSFRSGGIQTMVIVGILGGITFFLMVEVSRQIGVAGLVAPWVAVWVPILVAFAFATTIILHQEDG